MLLQFTGEQTCGRAVWNHWNGMVEWNSGMTSDPMSVHV